jgi:alginate O-acetyltransferase complex protein AlgI
VLFNSLSFLAAFAALAVVYYSVPHRVRWMLLLVASLGFYATFKPSHVGLLIGMTLVAYAGGLGIAVSADRYRRRGLLLASITAVLGVLFVFKYFDFFSRSIGLLPRLNLAAAAGLSFYSLSCLSYLADVYAGRLNPERHAGYFALYVSFFPKLLAGPIERARPFLAQMRSPVSFSAAGVTAGLQLMLWGLFKKVVIADRLAEFVDAGYGRVASAPPADLLLATYFFAFQLYCDFSGYSDMAIGAARVLGFTLMENFRRPYLSTSVSEFWGQRWHLSLSSWFRDYVYIPLGGNRASRIRRCANLMTVFLLSGLWHGASWTFVVWGALNGSYQVIGLLTRGVREKAGLLRRLPRPRRFSLESLRPCRACPVS